MALTDFHLRIATPHREVIGQRDTRTTARYRRGVEVQMFETRTLLGTRGREVLLPMPVTIRLTADYVAVVEPITGVHGVGTTAHDAVVDFWRAVVEWIDAIGDDPEAPNLRHMRVVLDQFLNS